MRQRPVNSLLEEDLEFERVVKPVPVVTEESVSSLEELIKMRILDVCLALVHVFVVQVAQFN